MNLSKLLFNTSDCEWITLVAFYKRATVIESLSISSEKSNHELIALDFFKKERCLWFAHESSESLSKNERFARKKTYFLYVFHSFTSPFLCPRVKRSHRSSLGCDESYENKWVALCSFLWANAILLTKNVEFARKTDSQIPNPVQYTPVLLSKNSCWIVYRPCVLYML